MKKTNDAQTSLAVSGEDFETTHIGVLDGIRVLAVGIVVWFHFWQQNWLSPNIGPVDLEFLPRYGYLMVDMMILISGFLLALPYAKAKIYGTPTPDTKSFYIKRFARIGPAYYFIIFAILLAVAIPQDMYATGTDLMKDLVPHVFFIHNLFPASYVGTHLDAALWTVAVLVQLYAIFPFVIKGFNKKPILTYSIMTAISVISTMIIVNNETATSGYEHIVFWCNNTLSFLCVYANGILAAYAYISFTKGRKRTQYGQIFATVIAIGCIIVYRYMCGDLARAVGENAGGVWQLEKRYVLSLVCVIFVLAVICSMKWFRKIFDNRVMKWLAGISFSMYMVHQYICERLHYEDVPEMIGENPGDSGLLFQWEKLGLCLGISLVLAIGITYLIEKPGAKFIKERFLKGKKKS
ncbi:MAG: acyltransferase [Eubacterium sp.]|nr:acyltransferase [Eubacterium sp.]